MAIAWPADGAQVCITGVGTANIVHYHGTIVRRTKTMIFTEGVWLGHQQDRRYRIADGHEVGASAYGGTRLDTKCQRPRRKN